MILKTKVRKIGNSLGILLPKEAVQALSVKEGQAVYLTEGTENSVRLSANQPHFDRMMEIAEKAMMRYRNALAELAK